MCSNSQIPESFEEYMDSKIEEEEVAQVQEDRPTLRRSARISEGKPQKYHFPSSEQFILLFDSGELKSYEEASMHMESEK